MGVANSVHFARDTNWRAASDACKECDSRPISYVENHRTCRCLPRLASVIRRRRRTIRSSVFALVGLCGSRAPAASGAIGQAQDVGASYYELGDPATHHRLLPRVPQTFADPADARHPGCARNKPGSLDRQFGLRCRFGMAGVGMGHRCTYSRQSRRCASRFIETDPWAPDRHRFFPVSERCSFDAIWDWLEPRRLRSGRGPSAALCDSHASCAHVHLFRVADLFVADGDPSRPRDSVCAYIEHAPISAREALQFRQLRMNRCRRSGPIC